jgi:hypothetical protein
MPLPGTVHARVRRGPKKKEGGEGRKREEEEGILSMFHRAYVGIQFMCEISYYILYF